jgi:metallo-beta-lactamase class B
MKSRAISPLPAAFLAGLVLAAASAVIAQSAPDTVQAHVALARAAAGQDHPGFFNRLCNVPDPPYAKVTEGAAPPAAAAPSAPPDRATWHAEPVKVFDNLYFLGQTEVSSWAVNTSDGIILIDAIYDYSVDDEVVKGMQKLGLDPAKIKYVIVTHAHSDHFGGAKLLQDRYGAHVILSAAEWDGLARDTSSFPKPKHDMVMTDGERLTLGNTTLTMYLTPGHTLGTISLLIPVTDGGTPHFVAEWGGASFNWIQDRDRATYITSDRPDKFWFTTYRDSSLHFRDIVARAGADVVIANHPTYDESKTKLPAVLKRKPGDPNPYVIGKDAAQRYFTVGAECAEAGLLRVAPARAAR